MQRFTKRDENNIAYAWTEEGPIYSSEITRLAEYEDIGLTPEQIKEVDKLYTEKCEELARYKKLEEQGRLLELPCKEGTPVYMIEQDCGGDTIACHYRECETCGDLYRYVEQNVFEAYMRDDIGKTVFLTKEEADAKLAE